MQLSARTRACSLLTALAFVSACHKLPSYRYKITVTVETPQGVRTGSAVREVDARSEPHFLPEAGGIFTEVHGEAVVVDLPGGNSLFALLNAPTPGGAPAQVPLDAFRDHFNPPNSPYKEMAEILSRTKLKADLSPANYPNFAIFRDSANAASVVFVDPTHPERTLGPQVRVTNVAIETTRAELTSGIEQRLPWLRRLTTTLGGQPYKNDDSAANRLARKDFIQP